MAPLGLRALRIVMMVSGIPLSIGKPLPIAGVFARGQAEVVADYLIHANTGLDERTVFEGHSQCFLKAGNDEADLGSGNFYAEAVPRVKLRSPHLGKVAF